MAELLPFAPENPVKEQLAFKTQVITAVLAEQRIAKRFAGRQTFEYNYRLFETDVARAAMILRRGAGAEWLVPVWHEMIYVGALSAGATSITVDTTSSDYRAASSAFVWESNSSYEQVTTASVAAGSLSLSPALGNTYTSAWVMPLRTAYSLEPLVLSAYQADAAEMEASLTVLDNVDLQAVVYDSYGGLPVLYTPPLAEDTPTSFEKKQTYFGQEFGKVLYTNEVEYLRNRTVATFRDYSRSSLWTRRQFLHAMKGKQGAFWMPTFRRDLSVQVDIGAADTTFTVESVGTSTDYLNRNIGFFLKDGTRLYRQITAVTASGANDILTITALGQVVAVADIEHVSFLNKSRLDTDVIRFEHMMSKRSNTALTIMEVPD